MTTTTPTVRDIAAGSLAAVRVFERLGIDYCCGGKRPLDEVCAEKGLPLEAVQRELDTAMADRQADDRDWNAAPLADLIAHIVATHHEYLRRELPSISQRLAKVSRVYGEDHPERLAGLPEVFEAVRAELESHLQKEEMMLFPAIAAYEKAAGAGMPLPFAPFGTVNNPIRMMEHEHESAGEALRRMREITRDYEIPDYACVTYRSLLRALEEFEADLHVHIHLENNILHPRAAKLEASLRG